MRTDKQRRKQQRQRKTALWVGVFCAMAAVGFGVWNRIFLPFKNPWNVTGLLTEMGYNPNNDLVRLIVFLLLPLAGLLAAFFVCKRLGWSFFQPVERPTLQPLHTRHSWVYVAVAVCLCVMVFGMQVRIQTYLSYGGLDTFHEGESLGPAVGYAAGQAPYRDMVFAHGIIQDPGRAVAAWALFGRSIASVRLLESLLQTLTFIMLALAVLVIFRWQPLPVILLVGWVLLTHGTTGDNPTWFMPLLMPSRDITTYSFLLVVGIMGNRLTPILPTKKAPTPGLRWYVLFFLFSFIPLFTYAYSIDRAFYLSAAWLIAGALLYITCIHKTPLAKAFWLAGGVGALVGLVAEGCICRWAVGDFIDFVFLKMPRFKELMDGMIFNPAVPVNAFILLQAAGHLFWMGTRLLQQVTAQGWAQGLRAFVRLYFTEITLALFATFFYRSAMGRSDWSHLSYSYIPTVILSGVILGKHYIMPWVQNGAWTHKQRTQWLAAACVVMLLLGGAFLGDGWGKLDDKYPVGAPDEAYVMPSYYQVMEAVQKRLQGGTFMTMTNEAFFYYLGKQPCPVRFPVVWFAMPSFYQEQMIQQMAENDVQVIIYDSGHWANAIDGFRNRDRLPILNRYIRKYYTSIEYVNGHEIMIRRDLVQVE